MTQHDEHFEAFQGHTLLKHGILRAYLLSWAFKLLQGPRGHRVYFVDAFAGEGRDGQGNPGSPLIATRIAAIVRDRLAEAPGTAGRSMRVIAIEKKPSHFKSLDVFMREIEQVDPDLFVALKGELSEHISDIVRDAAKSPTLYFFDPFGIKGLDASTYPQALAGPQNEIFALFADMGAGRLHGLVTADTSDINGQIRRLRENPSLFPEIDAEVEAQLAAEAEAYRAALDLSQPASKAHLTRALGGVEWEAELRDARPEVRPSIFLQLFIKRLIGSGARYVLTLPMRNDRGQRVYSLVHASKSAEGFCAMKEAISDGLKKELLPPDVSARIREDLSVSVGEIADRLYRAHAGTELSWTKAVQPAVLRGTGLFNFQLPDLRSEFVARGWIAITPKGNPKTPIKVRFLPTPS